MTSTAFTATLWQDIEGVYAAILEHPFLRGLTDGGLDEDAFAFYVIQDAHYLRDYARALALVGAKAPRETDIAMFARHAAGAIEVERALHEGLFRELWVSAEAAAKTSVAPTTLAYTSYLLATAYGGSFAEGLGAVLPCYWIYWEVGKALERAGSADPLYARWIATYAAAEFGAVVKAVLDAVDAVAVELHPAERDAMRRHAVVTSRYEWMFWDMGHRLEPWPL